VGEERDFQMLKATLRLLLRWLFGFRAYGETVLAAPGPVLLVPNHVSWIDWLFLGACLDEDWKFVVSREASDRSWLHRKLMINRRTFPLDTTSPYAVKRMAEYLQANGRLVLFAEGRLSRTGCLMKLFDGTGFLLHKVGAKVITCYLRGAHRLPLSPNPNAKRWFPTVTAHFSDVLTPPRLENVSTTQGRTRLTNWLLDCMVRQQFKTEMAFGPRTVADAIVETAAMRPGHEALRDLTSSLTYRRLLVGAHLLRDQLKPALEPGSQAVGVLLPNVNALPVVLLALWSLGRTPAMLNFSTGPALMLACARLAGLKEIVTSRTFIERTKLSLESLTGMKFIYLEDLRGNISPARKFSALVRVSLAPRSALPMPVTAESTAVVLFTSGSEGVPKGVELTHANILCNVRQMTAVLDLQDTDRFFNAMPLFHSFGLTAGTLAPLVRGLFVYLYPSPLHYRVVPTMFYFSDCTVMLGTNTFLNGYARKGHPLEFRSMRYLFTAGEKLQAATATAWSQRFGVRVLEGYGATECSPCVSLSLPGKPKPGSAGRLLPGIEWKLQPVEGVPEGGRLLVRGANVMRGYLNPEANAKFKELGGWYDTGDLARVDEDNFLFILGRLKRFAKVSGEMVSLTAVEDALAGAFPQYGLRCLVAVLSRPDENKGEMLIAVTNEPRLQLDEIRSAIRANGFPNICVPREVEYVHEIPKLGTGKVDYRKLQELLQ
jgi:acyl-[acyl-carrier-protein]-phospholipid O-acyltransferase/long-chain-fatty-acid--[acyl-carrier-protein] ligase